MRKIVLLLFAFQAFSLFAQESSSITGKVVDNKTQAPLQSIVVSVVNTAFTTVTNSEGDFVLNSVPPGSQVLQLRSDGYTTLLLDVTLTPGETLNLGLVIMEYDNTAELQLAIIALTESDFAEDNSGSESTAGLLQASRDVFLQNAAFNFGQARFRVRGLDNEYGQTMINGVEMNKLFDGRPQWNNWGGLNDATRNQEFTNGSAPSDYTFGSLLGTQVISTRASEFRPGSRASFSSTNTNYNFRTMITHASGMSESGWAYVFSAGRRWAEEGYFEGTPMQANSLFAAIEKKIDDNHSVNFTAIYAQNSRGRNSSNTEEINNLMGVRYNSFWGMQNGRIRNSRERNIEEPIFMLSHYWRISDKTRLQTNVMHQFGTVGNSRLDFNNVENPDPAFFRRLPSFFTTQHTNVNGVSVWTPNYVLAMEARDAFIANPQVDWDRLYATNLATTTGESRYVLFEDRTDDSFWVANTILHTQLADNIVMNGGLKFRTLRSQNFRNLLDLLGGQFFNDVDPFFIGDRAQPDLNNPNRIVGVGDRYRYNFILNANVIDAFTQFKFTYNKVDFYLAQEFSRTEYQRNGLMKNGIYPQNSFGNSRKVAFDNFGFKGGATYKLTGRHLFDINGIFMTNAPTMRNTFPNARLSNQITPNIDSEVIFGGDVSYILRAPRMKARATAYFSRVQNATDVGFYFAEGVGIVDDTGQLAGGNGNAFVAEIVTGINRLNMGGELGFEYQMTSTIRWTAVAAYGQFTIDNDPNVQLNADNVARTVDFGRATMRNYRQAGMPQQAYSLGVEYRDPKFWWIGANINHLAANYVDISAIMRTDNFFNNDQVPIDNQPISNVDEELARRYLRQERLRDVTLVNLVGGKSWRVSRKNRNTAGFFASVNNLFDITYRTGGFEQGRNANFTQVDQDHQGGVRSFGPRYFYGFGRNFFLNLYYNF